MSGIDPTQRTGPFYSALVLASAVVMLTSGLALVIVMIRSTLGPFSFFEDPGPQRTRCLVVHAIGPDARTRAERWQARAPQGTGLVLETTLERAVARPCPVLVVVRENLVTSELAALGAEALAGRQLALVGASVDGHDPLRTLEVPGHRGVAARERRAELGAGRVGWIEADPDGGAAVSAIRPELVRASRSMLAWLYRVPFVELRGPGHEQVLVNVEFQGPRRFLLALSNRGGRDTPELELRVHLNHAVDEVALRVTTLDPTGSAKPRKQVLHGEQGLLELVLPALAARSSRSYTLDLSAPRQIARRDG